MLARLTAATSRSTAAEPNSSSSVGRRSPASACWNDSSRTVQPWLSRGYSAASEAAIVAIWSCACAWVAPLRRRPSAVYPCRPRLSISHFASREIGIQRSVAAGKPSAAGTTPMTVSGTPSTRTLRPTAVGSPPSCARQNRSLTTTTWSLPGLILAGGEVATPHRRDAESPEELE